MIKLVKKISASNSNGTTLIELLVTIIITGIILTAAFRIYLVQQKGWIVQSQVSNMQYNARVSLRELTHKIRMAGYGLPNGVTAITPNNTNPDTITITYCSTPACNAIVEVAMSLPSSKLVCTGHDVSCLSDSQWAYVYDPNTRSGEFFYITHVDASSSYVEHTASLSKAYPQGSSIIKIEQTKYYVDNTTNPDSPCLMIKQLNSNPIIYTTSIEDLQLVYTLADGSTSNQPTSPNLIRNVKITLTARTERKDLQFEGDYRRRVLSSEVNVRNLGLSK